MTSKVLKLVLLAGLLAIFVLPIASAQANGTNSTGNSTNASAQPTATPVPKPSGIDVEASFFVKQGERSELRAFNHESSKHYVVLVNGKESVVFDASLKPVSDEAKLRATFGSYIAALDLPFKQADLDTLKADYLTLATSFNQCGQAYYNFTKGVRNCFIVNGGVWLCSLVYETELTFVLNGTVALTPSKKAVNEGNAKMNASLANMSIEIAALEQGFSQMNSGDISARLSAVGKQAADFRAGYNRFTEGHNVLVAYKPFATDGGLNRCAISTTALASIESKASISSQIPNAAELATHASAFTKERAASAAALKSAGELRESLDAFDQKLTAFKAAFGAVNNLEATYFIGARSELSTLLEKIAAGGNLSAQSETEFKAKFAEASAALDRSSEAVDDYAASSAALANASANLAEAAKKYGTSDPRVAEAEASINSQKAMLELKEADLKSGRPVTESDFKAIEANTTVTSRKVATMGRLENEFDFVTIGGAVLLIIIVVGGFFFIRNMKKRQGL